MLAKFLKGVCLGFAAQRPHDEHAAQLDLRLNHADHASKIVRLRASLFVNLVAMRECMGKHRNKWRGLLDVNNIETLRNANFLFHAAFNRCPTMHGFSWLS